jgi:DNA-binding winged helix-turn-helix (wHTH) protein/TolB-like protein/Flp pilus assembly protein TadD
MIRQENNLYEFGPYHLAVQERLLTRDGEVIPLAPKAVDLLVALVENSGHVLGKDELMKQVWPDSFVEEANLSHHIFTLRKALGEDKNGAKYIETIPRRGYRFVAEVTEIDDTSNELVLAERTRSRIIVEQEQERPLETTSRSALAGSGHKRKLMLAAAVSAGVLVGLGVVVYFLVTGKPEPGGYGSAIKSIAVLPFKPLVADSRDEALELGMAETLIARLSNLRDVKVRPTSAVRKYVDLQQDAIEAGRELQVESVLDASIQKSGDRLRVVARLVRVDDGTTLWADKFDEKLTDLFTVQDRISERMTAALALPLTGEERRLLAKRYTENVEAYQLYTRGRYYWSKFTDDGLRKSIGLFEQAIDSDPTYALAYSGLCNAYMVLGVNGHMSPKEARPKAKYAAEKAIELDDRLAWAHQSLGGYKLFHEWDWAGAEREFKRAMELDPGLIEPHELYSYLLSELGHFDEALAELRKAQEINPVAVNIGSSYGDTLRQARRYDQAITELEKTREMDPDDFFTLYTLGLAYAQKGLYEKAIIESKKAVDLSGNSTRVRSGLGQVYAMAGKYAEARKVIAELQTESKQRYVSPLYIALIYATLGENDQAFSWLEKAFEDRACWLIELGIEPSWDKLRSDPRFTDMLRRVGLVS